MLHQPILPERADVRLGVADIDDEQHQWTGKIRTRAVTTRVRPCASRTATYTWPGLRRSSARPSRADSWIRRRRIWPGLSPTRRTPRITEWLRASVTTPRHPPTAELGQPTRTRARRCRSTRTRG